MASSLKVIEPCGGTSPMIAFKRGRAADAVAAENADDLAGADAKRDALQDVALAVVGVQIADLEHHAAVPR